MHGLTIYNAVVLGVKSAGSFFTVSNILYIFILFLCGEVHVIIWNVTVIEALVLCPPLEDRGCITESVHILEPVDRMKQKCFQITTKRVRRLQYCSTGMLIC